MKSTKKYTSITVAQLRAARALLGWSQAELGDRANLSLPTVKRVETERGPKVSDEARHKLKTALEAAGIEFINGGAIGAMNKITSDGVLTVPNGNFGTERQVSGSQIRAARALLRWKANELAERTKLGIMTIRRAEAVDGEVPVTAANAETIRRTLEAAGVEFTNGETPGVRMKVKRGK